MVRWCWINFQCRGVLLIWIRIGQGPTALAVGAGGGCLDIFSLVYHFSFPSPSLSQAARYRLKYCLKGPLSPNQPTNSTKIAQRILLRCTKWPPELTIEKMLNRWTEIKIISQECFLGDCLPKLLKPFRSVEQDGHQS